MVVSHPLRSLATLSHLHSTTSNTSVAFISIRSQPPSSLTCFYVMQITTNSPEYVLYLWIFLRGHDNPCFLHVPYVKRWSSQSHQGLTLIFATCAWHVTAESKLVPLSVLATPLSRLHRISTLSLSTQQPKVAHSRRWKKSLPPETTSVCVLFHSYGARPFMNRSTTDMSSSPLPAAWRIKSDVGVKKLEDVV